MKVIFDTGSSIPWVLSEQCQNGNCPKENKKFSEKKSSTFYTQELKGVQKLTYGRGVVAGSPGQDTICFSPSKSSCVEKMTFLTIQQAKDIASLQGSGLIGLSPAPSKKGELKQPFTHGVSGFIN